MEAINPFHHLNPSLHNSVTRKRPRSHSTISSVLGVAETSQETKLSSSLLSSSSTFHCFNGHQAHNSSNSIKVMHGQMIKKGKEMNSDSNTQSLIRNYLHFGDFRSASTVFFVGYAQNYLHWNDFLEDFKRFGGDPYEILETFCELHNKKVSYEGRILTVILKLCANLTEIWLGIEVHACMIKKGHDIDVYSKVALMNFYARLWGIDYINQLFDEMPERQDLLWNEAVLVNLRNERWMEALRLFRDMHFSFLKPNIHTIAKVLQACAKLGALDQGKQIHGYVIRSALMSNTSICNSLISMYSRNNNLRLARAVFDLMENRNLSAWNSIISGYIALGHLHDARKLFYNLESSDVKPDIVTWNCLLSGHFLNGLYGEILFLLQKMQAAGYKPNSSSISITLQAISELRILNLGKQLHNYVTRHGLDYDIYVGTSLLDMYVKNDNLTYARSIFDNMKNKNVFAWNSMIVGYSFKGQFEDAIKLFNQMENEGSKPDLVTHNSLVSGYSMWGYNKEAVSMVDQIKASGLTPNVVTWTALISGCVQKGNFKDALEFSIQMQQEGINANSATVSSLLRACAGLSSLHKGKEIHCVGIREGFVDDVFVATALVDMYSKCGNLRSAYEVFQKIHSKTLATWNSMIMSFAIYSQGKEAISLFNQMQEAGIQPDGITFTALLSACKNSGLVDEGWKYFDSMKADYNIVPTIEHYSCMVDLLGRAGYLDEAQDFIETMPISPDATVWGALLGSSRVHENLDLAEIAAENLFKLESYNPANYVLMMNLYASLSRWEDVACVKELMYARGVTTGQVCRNEVKKP
ncbi:hypothetical protein NMG60_11022748 [Bertholletia excelsa]